MTSTNIDPAKAVVGRGTSNSVIVEPKVYPRTVSETKEFFAMPSIGGPGAVLRIEIPMNTEVYQGHYPVITNMQLLFDMGLPGVAVPAGDYLKTRWGALCVWDKITFFVDSQPVLERDNSSTLGYPLTQQWLEEVLRHTPTGDDTHEGFRRLVYGANPTATSQDHLSCIDSGEPDSYQLPTRSLDLGMLTNGWLHKQIDCAALGQTLAIELRVQTLTSYAEQAMVYWQNTSATDNRTSFRVSNVQVQCDYTVFPQYMFEAVERPRRQYFRGCAVTRIDLPAAGVNPGDSFTLQLGQDFPPHTHISHITVWGVAGRDAVAPTYANAWFNLGGTQLFTSASRWTLQHESIDSIKADTGPRVIQQQAEAFDRLVGQGKIALAGSAAHDQAVWYPFMLAPSCTQHRPSVHSSEQHLHVMDTTINNVRATEWTLTFTPNRTIDTDAQVGPCLYAAIHYAMIRELRTDTRNKRCRVTTILN